MLIGLISDTHIPDRARQIPQKVLTSFKDVDLIIHAGDLTTQSVIDELEEIAPVMAIQGNMDRVAGFDLPKARVIDVEGVRIGVAHGEVYPRADTQQLLYLAKQLDVNILVTGHSHQPKIEQLADRTVMLLEVNDKNVDVEIIKIGAPVCSALDFTQYPEE